MKLLVFLINDLQDEWPIEESGMQIAIDYTQSLKCLWYGVTQGALF